MSVFEQVGNLQRVDNPSYGDKRDAMVAILADGRIITVWTADGVSPSGADGSASGIKGRLSAADGTPLGQEFLINTKTAGVQQQPSVVALADGGFVVAWVDGAKSSSSPSYTIRAQQFASSGSMSGAERALFTGSTDAPVPPALTALSNGGWAIGYLSPQGGNYNMSGATFSGVANSAGTSWTAPSPSASGKFFLKDLALTEDPAGGFVATYLGQTTLADNRSHEGVYLVHLSAAGAVNGSIKTIVEYDYHTPRMASAKADILANGDILVGWTQSKDEYVGPFGPYNLSSRILTTEGNLTATQTHGLVGYFPLDEKVDVDALSDGTAVLSYGNAAWRIGADGAALGERIAISPGATYSQTTDVVADGDSFVVTYGGSADNASAIFDVRYDFVPTPVTKITVSGELNESDVGGMRTLTLGTDSRIQNGVTTYTIVNDPDHLFAISGDQLLLRAGAQLDFESKASAAITVKATDAVGNSVTQDFVISIVDSSEEQMRFVASEKQVVAIASPTRLAIEGLRYDGVAVVAGTNGASLSVVGADGVIKTNARSVGANSAIAALTDGGFALVSGGTYIVSGQRYTADGANVGLLTQLTNSAGQYDKTTAVDAVGLPGGGYAAAWGPNVYVANVSATGVAGTPAFISNYYGYGATDPALAVLKDGRTLAIWEREGGTYGRFANAQGAVGNIFTVSGRMYAPDIAALADGGYVVAGADSPNSGDNLSLLRYDSARQQVGDSILLDAKGAKVSLAGLADGGFVAAYAVYDTYTTAHGEAQIFNANGERVGDPLIITKGLISTISVTALGSDGFAIGWIEGDKAYLQRFDWSVRPETHDDLATVVANSTIAIDALANDFDPTGDGLTVRYASADHGTITVGQDGRLTYAPNADWYGVETIRYHVDTKAAGADNGLITVAVTDADGYIPQVGTDDWDNLNGTPFNDRIDGRGGTNQLYGFAGDDLLIGGSGYDIFYGGDGADTLVHNGGDDNMDGGAGEDIAVFAGKFADYRVTLNGDAANHAIGIFSAGSLERQASVENVEWLRFDDRLISVAHDAPTKISLSVSAVAEDTPQWTTLGLFSAQSASGNPLTYTLVYTDGAPLSIKGQRLISNAAFDYETRSSYNIVMSVSDGNFTVQKGFHIDIQDRPEPGGNLAPTKITFGPTSIRDDMAVGTSIGLLSSIDPEGGKLRWTLLDDAHGAVKLAGNKLVLAGPINAQATALSFTVQVKDDAANAVTQSFSMKVIDTDGSSSAQPKTMVGTSHVDIFRFLTMKSGADVVKGFAAGEDRIEIGVSTYAALADYGLGVLQPSELVYGTKASTADQHLIYNQTKGQLLYDADGAGGDAAIVIASFTNKPMIDADDIVLI